eukprot:12419938-Karenia_brevis.AAC.1
MGKFLDEEDQPFLDGPLHPSNDGILQDPQLWSDLALAGKSWFCGKDVWVNTFWQIVDENATGPCQDSQAGNYAVSWLRAL